MEWIVGYFSPREETKHPVNAFEALKEAKPIVVSDRMPIILQVIILSQRNLASVIVNSLACRTFANGGWL